MNVQLRQVLSDITGAGGLRMNTQITRCESVTDRLIIIAFANGTEMHLVDASDQYECIRIHFKGNPSPWII
jgi:hypothetical protein